MPFTTQGSNEIAKCNIIGHKPKLFLLALVLALIIGWIDYVTEWELSLFVLCSVPIAIVAWWCANIVGLLIALLCCVIWLATNLGFSPYKTDWEFALATVSRWYYFFWLPLLLGLQERSRNLTKNSSSC